MAKKENNRNYLDLADQLKLKLEHFSSVMEVADKRIKLFPAGSDGKVSQLGILSSVVITEAINFCNTHDLQFYVSYNIAHSCPEFVIY